MIFSAWEMEAEGSGVQGHPRLGRASLRYPSSYLEVMFAHQQSTVILGNPVNYLPGQRRARHTPNLWTDLTVDAHALAENGKLLNTTLKPEPYTHKPPCPGWAWVILYFC